MPATPLPGTPNGAIRDCVDAVNTTFSSVFALIDSWRSAVQEFVSASDGVVTRIEVDEFSEALVVGELSRDGALVIGAGFVAAPAFIIDAPWHLAWWLGHANTFGLGSADPVIRRLQAEEDPESESFRDYTNLEWWRAPSITLAQHITGPYVDYLCTDDYTLTLTAPVLFTSRMIGVVGADLYVNDIERALLPRVASIDSSATIVNASGRVVISNDMARPTGSLLRLDTLSGTPGGPVVLSDGRTVIPCQNTSLLLVLDAP